jgi:hypothetical protein
MEARKSVMTLGQWLNHIIREVGAQEVGPDDDAADADTSQIKQLNAPLKSDLGSSSQEPQARTSGRRAEHPSRSGTEIGAVHAALADMVKRFEKAQQKSSMLYRDEFYQCDQDTLDRSLDSVQERVVKIGEEARGTSELIREKLYDLSESLESAAGSPISSTGGSIDEQARQLDSLKTELRDLGRKLDDSDKRFDGAINKLSGELVAIRVHLDQTQPDSKNSETEAVACPDELVPPDQESDDEAQASEKGPASDESTSENTVFAEDKESAQSKVDDDRPIPKEVLAPVDSKAEKQDGQADLRVEAKSKNQNNQDKEPDANALVALPRGVTREARASVKVFDKGDVRANTLDVAPDSKKGTWQQPFVTAGFLFIFFLVMTLGTILLLNSEMQIPGFGRPDVLSSLNDAAAAVKRSVLSLFD